MKNKDAFCLCVRNCEKAMYSLAFSIVRNNHDAEDIISESILRAYKSLDVLKDDKQFKPWMLRIVHNTAVEFIRKNTKILLAEEMEDAAVDAKDNEIVSRLALRDAVESLRQPYRTVVVLFYYEDLSIAEIAKVTGANAGAVKKQLSRARNMLQKILKEDFNQ